MYSNEITVGFEQDAGQYAVSIGHNVLDTAGEWARRCLGTTAKAAIISNPLVHGLYGDRVERSFDDAGIECVTFLVDDGEEFKNLDTAKKILSFLTEKGIQRDDAVVSVGGGVVGDVAAFAASVHLRGIGVLQIPTTLLSMIDSSVGGKTGVNTWAGKNLVGTFHHPSGVLVDVACLDTLDGREFRSGLYEAAKQGALSGVELLENTKVLAGKAGARSEGTPVCDAVGTAELSAFLARQISYKASIVSLDAKESVSRVDRRSRKVLNLGHTTAHALENITNYAYFTHGEAVGYGLLVASEISKRLEMCGRDSINLLNGVVRSVGQLPAAHDIDVDRVIDLFGSDKKSGGGDLQWVLIEKIGKPRIISSRDIPRSVITESLTKVLTR